MITLRANINGAWTDVTGATGNYIRSDNVDSLGMAFNFDLINNPLDKMFNRFEIPIGSKVVLSNNGANIFSGINKLCNENSIPLGAITNISTNVSKI